RRFHYYLIRLGIIKCAVRTVTIIDLFLYIDVDDGDTLNDILKKINDCDSPVRAFYDSQSDKVVMETTRTGKYNNGIDNLGIQYGNEDKDGPEIRFDNDSFFTNILKMDMGEE